MASGRVVTTLATYRNLDVQPTGAVIKNAPGEIAGWFLANLGATTRFVKFYDKATAPTQADTPLLTVPLAALAGANILAAAGVDFVNGISVRATTGVADNDTGAPTANDVVINVFYR